MSSVCKKWGYEVESAKDLYVVLFISRNKDNKDVKNFKERRMSFITTTNVTTDLNDEKLMEKFEDFVNNGVSKEMSRFYISVNARNPEKVRKGLIHFLIDEPNFNLAHIDGKLASIAQQKDCASEKKWMFDFDINNVEKFEEFLDDVGFNLLNAFKTPNGYAIITKHFDTRELLKKWGDSITLKRDDMLCYEWSRKV